MKTTNFAKYLSKFFKVYLPGEKDARHERSTPTDMHLSALLTLLSRHTALSQAA